jgi:hypothetical protein
VEVAMENQIDKILPTKEELDALLQSDEVIEQTAEEIMDKVFKPLKNTET